MSDSGSEYVDQRPPSLLRSAAETTPSQRAYETNTPVVAKRRVDKATCREDLGLTMKRCLIENTDESNHVEYAHCLPRSTPSDTLDSLEFAWEMDYLTLNVDSRYNIIRLSPKFHKAFDAKKWLLLPETSIINEYYDALEQGNFPEINNEVYRYKLLASSDMKGIPIHRQHPPPPVPPLQISAGDFTYFPHPYHDFPVLTSHVHPRFVICNSGPKIPGRMPFFLQEYREYVDDIAKVGAIWDFWTKPIPRGDPFWKKRLNHDPSAKDDDSRKSAPRRVSRTLRPKRKTREEQSSPTPMSSKQQRLANDGPWLDDETLHEFNQKTMPDDKPADIKTHLIMDWLTGVSHFEGKTGVIEKLNDVTDSDVAMDLGVEDTQMFMAEV